MKNLSQQEWVAALSQQQVTVILDVRTLAEVEEGKIPKAINLDILNTQEFMDGIEKFDKSFHYFVYCRAGSRSAQACAVMQQLGFEHAYNLKGGFSEWNGAVEY
jgi:rhodanese-related sulfurtransferase